MTTVVLMPGTGSDADYICRAFGPAVARSGGSLIALEPGADLLGDYRAALDAAAAEHGPVIVGGVSIGAVIGLRWALDHGDQACLGVLAALPPWTGPAGENLAALSARHTADTIERGGLDAAVSAMRSGSPDWLADELTRSWRSLYRRGLVEQLRAAAECEAPTDDQIARLGVPLAIAASSGDPLHPAPVAERWALAAPRSAVVTVPIAEWGPNEELLGEACVHAWHAVTGATLA